MTYSLSFTYDDQEILVGGRELSGVELSMIFQLLIIIKILFKFSDIV